MVKTLRELADCLEARLVGTESLEIKGVMPPGEAGPNDLTLIVSTKYRKLLKESRAGAVLQGDLEEPLRENALMVRDPYLALAKLLPLFYPERHPQQDGRGGSFIDDEASISPEAVVSPSVYVGPGTRIEKGAVLYPGVYIGADCVIGEDTLIYPNVTIYRRTLIGKRVIIQGGAVIGGDGFGFAQPGRGNVKIPQTGYVRIDDEVEIGANSTIDRGTLGATWIQRGVKIDNLVMVAHNVTIGENSLIVAQVGLAGSTILGKGVLVGGQAGLVGHITVGDGVMVAARAGVHKDVPAGQVVAGSPHLPHREWLRKEAALGKVPELREMLLDLKKKVEELEKQTGSE
jgi:UDP-3-O-[3-hydroxymyristoyl] glucosamine N-acyltransferase